LLLVSDKKAKIYLFFSIIPFTGIKKSASALVSSVQTGRNVRR